MHRVDTGESQRCTGEHRGAGVTGGHRVDTGESQRCTGGHSVQGEIPEIVDIEPKAFQ